jgi:hypothetical protein
VRRFEQREQRCELCFTLHVPSIGTLDCHLPTPACQGTRRTRATPCQRRTWPERVEPEAAGAEGQTRRRLDSDNQRPFVPRRSNGHENPPQDLSISSRLPGASLPWSVYREGVGTSCATCWEPEKMHRPHSKPKLLMTSSPRELLLALAPSVSLPLAPSVSLPLVTAALPLPLGSPSRSASGVCRGSRTAGDEGALPRSV